MQGRRCFVVPPIANWVALVMSDALMDGWVPFVLRCWLLVFFCPSFSLPDLVDFNAQRWLATTGPCDVDPAPHPYFGA